MRMLHYFLFSALGVIVTLNVIYFGVSPAIVPNIDSKIKELQAVQDQWVEQVELLIVIDRLSFNLQCAELDKKELFRELGKAVKTNNELRNLIQSLFQESIPNLPPNVDRST